MRKIIILKGISETGKTTKIKQIADWIMQNYTCSTTITMPAQTDWDIHGILTINKFTIGFNSAGDDENQVKKLDKLLIDETPPDIIICACRTKGRGLQYLKNNYNGKTGWLQAWVSVERVDPADCIERDKHVIDELKGWLIGLEKL